ncbi:FAD binding domain-containing protein [soil metagenome]
MEFVLNGRRVGVDAPPAGTTLLDFVRARGLTGAKEGCAEGECGACTVAMLVNEGTGSAFQVVNSCLMLLPMAAGREIYTVEALAEGGELTGAQRAMAAAGGSQCGYCTPGFVMSLFAEQYRPGRTGPCDPLSMAGNLCRCTGYRPIGAAADALGAAPDDRFSERLTRPALPLEALVIAGFSRPRSVEECVAILAHAPETTIVAGGTDLGVEANLRHRRWPQVMSVEAVDELREFADGPERVRIGAGLPLSRIGRVWRQAPAVVAEWLALFASPQIRNMATLGGNLATASPVGDAAPLLLALDASVQIAGPAETGGSTPARRTVPLSSFFVEYRRSALREGEILVSVEIPKPLPEVVRFYKVAKRRLDDISTVAAAMAIDGSPARVSRARFAFGGVAATPLRVTDAEAAVEGRAWDEHAVARVQDVLDRTLTPLSDHRGSKEYRLAVAKSLVEKFWWEGRA